MKKYSQGSVNGRFQPFHKDHLHYCLEAKKRCNFLLIGITQIYTKKLIPSSAGKHRAVDFNNPLTYFERQKIIYSSLLEAGLRRDSFEILPFPIDEPIHLYDFLPTTVPIFTTVNDQWNIHKIKILEKAGYRVIVLWRKRKVHQGCHIRELIYLDNPEWKVHVPPGSVAILEEINISKRLKELRNR
ncbi:MAG: hypothetical protein AB1427_14910 [Thermodesulfobacteriota bacterium]